MKTSRTWIAREQAAYEELDAAREEYDQSSPSSQAKQYANLVRLTAELDELLLSSEIAVSVGNQVSFSNYFRKRAMPLIFGSAIVVAIGIGLFAWAANPPTTPPVVSMRGANLRGADLSGVTLRFADLTDADLSGANLTGTDFTGAVLEGANLEGVTWSKTTCPDGKVSDNVAGTCLNHLKTSD